MITNTINKAGDKPIDLDATIKRVGIGHQASIEMLHDLKTDKVTIVLHNGNEVLMKQISGDELRSFAYKTETDLAHLAENS